MIRIHGLAPRTGDIAHGLTVVRFARPLAREEQLRARQRLVDAGAIAEQVDADKLEEKSSYVAGTFTPPKADGIDKIRHTVGALADELGADEAWFFMVETEADAIAAGAAEEAADAAGEDDDEDGGGDESDDADGEDGEDEDEDEEEEEEEGEEGDDEEQSFWKAGPPPGAEEAPFPVDGYPNILLEYDWEDFGIAVKLGGEERAGEHTLLDWFHTFWITPYIDTAAADAYADADSNVMPPFRHVGLVHDQLHRSALLWIDRFTPPAAVDEIVHHLLWIACRLNEVVPVVHARFAGATMEMKYQDSAQLVLAGNPLLTTFQQKGEAAALSWAESQRSWSPKELAAMFVELGQQHDPDEAEQAPVALRMFDRAETLDPQNEEAPLYALTVLVHQGRVDEALARAGRTGNVGHEIQTLGLLVERAPASLAKAKPLIRREVLDAANGSFLAALVPAVGGHAPGVLEALLAVLPENEETVSYVYQGVLQIEGPAKQLPILLRALDLPCADEGPHRENWLAALNAACVQAHAVKDYELAVKISDRAQPFADENPYIHHSVACAYAAVGRHDDAFRHVKRAFETGYDLVERMENDSDLGPILEWPEHKALFAAWRAGREKSEPVMHATDATFDELVLHYDKPVIVDFTASWCGPCQRLAPIVEQLAADSCGRYRVVKLDVDESEATSARFEVQSMPTLIVFSGGEPRARHIGLTDKKTLKSLLVEAGAKLS